MSSSNQRFSRADGLLHTMWFLWSSACREHPGSGGTLWCRSLRFLMQMWSNLRTFGCSTCLLETAPNSVCRGWLWSSWKGRTPGEFWGCWLEKRNSCRRIRDAKRISLRAFFQLDVAESLDPLDVLWRDSSQSSQRVIRPGRLVRSTRTLKHLFAADTSSPECFWMPHNVCVAGELRPVLIQIWKPACGRSPGSHWDLWVAQSEAACVDSNNL